MLPLNPLIWLPLNLGNFHFQCFDTARWLTEGDLACKTFHISNRQMFCGDFWETWPPPLAKPGMIYGKVRQLNEHRKW